MKRLPIGIQTFSKIRRQNLTYIDKTDMVWRLAQPGGFYFLSRPRRFGKSLLLTTLESYFRREEELFAGLKLEGLQRESGEEWLEYPVIRLSLVSCAGQDAEEIDRNLMLQFWNVDLRYGIDTSEHKASGTRLQHQVMMLYQKFQRGVVILIDEYDTPLLQTLRPEKKELHEQHRATLRGLYGKLKELEEYIHFALLTGVSEFSGLSLFSGLNNLQRLTLNDAYATVCGITHSELEEAFADRLDWLAEQAGVSRAAYVDRLASLYDGYRFSANGEYVFNPFCLLLALENGELYGYWSETGNASVVDYILPYYQINAGALENGVAIQRREMQLVEDSNGLPLPFLYQTGYLTIRDVLDEEYFLLGFPNNEVRGALAFYMKGRLIHRMGQELHDDLYAMKRALAEGDLKAFMALMEVYTAAMATGNEPADSPMREAYFRNTMFTVLMMLKERARVEVPSALGRADCEVELVDRVYIFELKLKARGSVREALAQIGRKRYGDKYATCGKRLLCVGAVFDAEGKAEWEAMGYEEVLALAKEAEEKR